LETKQVKRASRTLEIRDRCGWWWRIYDANVDASWTTDGKRTYASVLAAAIYRDKPQLSLDRLETECEALWRMCIDG